MEQATFGHEEPERHFTRISDYIDAHIPVRRDYPHIINVLRSHPNGYRRAFAMYFSDADICNGGFRQYYQNLNGCLTMSAIEGYAQIGASTMVSVMMSALKVCFTSFPEIVAETDFGDVPKGDVQSHIALVDDWGELDKTYYIERERLPCEGEHDWLYLDGPIDYYYKNFPGEFVIVE
jgi:hypothetical protein